jgi:hypothetical protein
MPPHGTYSRYTNQECRCDQCRAANAEYARRRRRERVVDDWAKHGRVSTYKNYMCRCDDCRAAVRAEGRVRRAS